MPITEHHHIIQKQVVELTVPDKQLALSLQSEASMLVRNFINTKLEEICDKFCGTDEVLKIDKLTIDLGSIGHSDFRDTFINKTPGRFEDIILQEINDKLVSTVAAPKGREDVAGFQKDESAGIISTSEKELECLVHFLKTGILPWNIVKEKGFSIEKVFQNILKTNPAQLKLILKQLLRDVVICRRFDYQFSEEIKTEALKLFQPSHSEKIITLKSVLENFLLTSGFRYGQTQRPGSLIWFSIYHTISIHPDNVSVKELQKRVLKTFIKELSSRISNTSVDSLLLKLKQQVTGIYIGYSRKKEMAVFNEVKDIIEQIWEKDNPLKNDVKRAGKKKEIKGEENLAPGHNDKLNAADSEEAKTGTRGGEAKQNNQETTGEIIEKEGDKHEKSVKKSSAEATQTEQDKRDNLRIEKDKKENASALNKDEKGAKGNDTSKNKNADTANRNDPSRNKNAEIQNGNDSSINKNAETRNRNVSSKSMNAETQNGNDSLKNRNIEARNENDSSEFINELAPDRQASEEPKNNSVTSNEEATFSSVQDEYNIELPHILHTNPDEIYIDNAGLVILWPYIQGFFDRLGYLKDKKEFIDTETIYRAVNILQYVVTGQTGQPEYELTLNKLLCGLEITEPVPVEVTVTEKEKDECRQMLEAAVQNWEVLKNTSIDGLRSTFLNRQGILSRQAGGWKVFVERDTIDILLDRLPWAISVIRLPWSKELIYVEW